MLRYPDARHDAWHEWRRRLRGEPDLPAGSLGRVLFVCHGNICRSPFAERVLRERLPALEVRSAGLEAAEGNPADPAALRAAARAGCSLDAHRTRRMTPDQVAWADLVLGMEGSHARRLLARWPEARPKLRLLGDFLASPPHRLQDPWGQPDAVFDQVFGRVVAAVERLARRLEEGRAA